MPLTLSLLRQSALSASGGRSSVTVTQSSASISTSNVISSTSSGINSRVSFTPPQLAPSNLSDLSLSSYLAAAAAAVNASNNGTFASHYNLNHFQQQIQRHSTLGQHQQSAGGNYHHILRSHVPLASSLPQSIVASSSLSSVSAAHLQQMCRQQQDQTALANISSRQLANAPQYQQQQYQQTSDNSMSNLYNLPQLNQSSLSQFCVSAVLSSSSTVAAHQQQSRMAQAAVAAAAASFLPSSVNQTQNFLSSSLPAQSSSYFNTIISSGKFF